MRRILAAVVVALSGSLMVAPVATASPPATLVVDDDGAQCAGAGYRSIGAAVTAANAGDTVRVCPGIYRERVDVTKPLQIIGQPGVAGRVPCVDDAWTPTVAVDPSALAVIEPPDGEISPLVRLHADRIEPAGLVVQGQPDPGNEANINSPAVQADGAFSGHRIHHNLVQNNTLGIEIGSNGKTLSQVDHNCLRGNEWAVSTQRYTAINVRVDHNEAFRTQVIPYEATTFASQTQGQLVIKDVRFDHNRSVVSGYAAYLLEGVQSSQFDHNTVEAAGQEGIALFGGNHDVILANNALRGSDASIGGFRFVPPDAVVSSPSSGVVLSNNRVEGFTIGIFVAINARTTDTQVLDNVTSGNRLVGIQVGISNTGARVQGNVSDHNAYGIRTAAASVAGNSFVGNSMHGNTVLDAQESNVTSSGGSITLGNTWTGNRCDTDSPAGALCAR